MPVLDGVRVLEFGHAVAGPFATAMLGDFGAEVIKIERPGKGDSLRRMGPRDASGLWFAVAGRNKRSLEVDLDTPEGNSYIKGLAADADVIVENFRPGVMESFGLGWADIEQMNPRAVMLRISGFGQDGPYRERRGFGKIAEAFSGATNLTGYTDGPPVHPGYSLADALTGLFGAYGVVLALRERDASGVGQCVDLGLYDGLLRMVEWQIPFWEVLGLDSQRSGASFPFEGAFVTEVCEASDGRHVVVSAATSTTIERLMKFLRDEDLFASEALDLGAGTDTKAVARALQTWVKRSTAAEAVEQLEALGIVAGHVYRPSDLAQDPHIAERGSLVPMETDDYGIVRVPAPVPRLSRTPGEVKWEGPELGNANGMINTRARESQLTD